MHCVTAPRHRFAADVGRKSQRTVGAPCGVYVRRARFEALDLKKEGESSARGRSPFIESPAPCRAWFPDCDEIADRVPCRARLSCRALLGSPSAYGVPLACCAVPCLRVVPRRQGCSITRLGYCNCWCHCYYG